jgi:glycosyltransferase involved in cell wall biosynthesis
MTDNVTIVIESLGGGGAQHVAVTLANAWVGQGKHVTVITFQGSSRDAFHLDTKVNRIVIGESGDSRNIAVAVVSNLRSVARLRRALKAVPRSVVISFIGSTNILAILASIGLGHRIIISERNDPARQSLGRLWDALRKLFYRRANLVVANSRSAIESMAAYVPREKMLWLPNPLRIQRDAQSSVTVVGPYFLTVGRLESQKAFDLVIKAFADALPRLPSWQLVMLGDGQQRLKLAALAATLNISEHVKIVGYVSDPFAWYRSAQVLVHPARFEGLPNVVLEAMSEALPVIVSDAQTGLVGIVQDGISGMVIPDGSASTLKDAMVALAESSSLRRSLGAAAQEAVAEFEAGRAINAWSKAVSDVAR